MTNALKLIKLLIVGTTFFFLSSCDKPPLKAEGWIHLSSQKGEIPAPGPSTQQTACLILDVDRDGKNDFIIGSRKKGPSVLWYQRTKSGWTKHIVDDALLPIEAGGAYDDIDNDGELDIISIGWSHDRVLLYENKAIKLESEKARIIEGRKFIIPVPEQKIV